MFSLSSCSERKPTKAELKETIFRLKEMKATRTRANHVVAGGIPHDCYKKDLKPEECEKEKAEWKENSDAAVKEIDDEIEALRHQVEEIERQEAENSSR